MRSRWLAMLVLLISAPACTTEDTSDEDGASTGAGAGAGEDLGSGSGDEPPTPPSPPPEQPQTQPPVATNKCVDDEDVIGSDGKIHLVPDGCQLVDDTSKCCLDTTGTKWMCTGGDEFPGVLDIHDYAKFPCPGL